MAAFSVVLAAAIVQFGGLPSYADPDPKWIQGTDLVYEALLPLFFPALVSPLVVGGEAAWRNARREGLRPIALAAYALGFGLFGAIMFADAFGLRNWILD
jgi:hypothetical protein